MRLNGSSRWSLGRGPPWVVAVMVGAVLSGAVTAEGRARSVEGDATLEVAGEDGAEAEAGSLLSNVGSGLVTFHIEVG